MFGAGRGCSGWIFDIEVSAVRVVIRAELCRDIRDGRITDDEKKRLVTPDLDNTRPLRLAPSLGQDGSVHSQGSQGCWWQWRRVAYMTRAGAATEDWDDGGLVAAVA